MILGLPYDGVAVVDSDPDWPTVGSDLAARVRAALGGSAGLIEHVGSTAVPGLAAKPIIDLAVELVADVASWLAVRDRLRADPVLREQYARLKKELARRFPNDRTSYSRGKATFIRQIAGANGT